MGEDGCQPLLENERNWTEEGQGRPRRPLPKPGRGYRSSTKSVSMVSNGLVFLNDMSINSLKILKISLSITVAVPKMKINLHYRKKIYFRKSGAVQSDD